MIPGGSGCTGTLTTLRWSLVPGLPDFSADGLRRGGHPRFGSGPDPLSSVPTLTPGQRPAPDELDARKERSMPVFHHGRVFTPGPAPGNPYTIQLERYYESLLSEPAKSGKRAWSAPLRTTSLCLHTIGRPNHPLRPTGLSSLG
jgi:hypothetical protein